jgi:PAS domain S-box-containing protein
MPEGDASELFQLITESIGDVFWVMSGDFSRLLYVSPSYEKVWRQSCESLRRDASTFLEPVHPDDLPRVHAVLADQRAGRSFDHEYRLVHEDGSVTWIWDRGFPVFEATGALRCYVGLSQDITRRKTTEAELGALAERFRLVSRTTNDGIWDWDPNAEAVWWSDACYDHLGCDRSVTPSYEAWVAHIHPDDRDRVSSSLMRQVTQGKDEVWLAEYRIIKDDGAVREMFDRAYLIRDADGHLVRAIGSVSDITPRRNLEAQLRQAQKMEAVGQLAGGIAHDFNNILQAALLELQMLQRRALPGDVTRRLEDVQADLNRAAKLTRQLLVFSRRKKVQPRWLDLNVVISDVASMLRRLLGDDVMLEVNLAREPLHVHADRSMVDQILMNLAVNARDAMPQGGTVTVTTSLVDRGQGQGPLACVTVKDTGAGIPPDVMPHIFEPFFTTKDIGRGTGLGLATALSIAEQHQGFIEVDSEVGQGATFHTFLPSGTPPAETSTKGVDLAASRGHETILVVEDEPAVRRAVRLLLEQQGYRVVEADNGPEALRVWDATENISLLFTDLMMPGGIDGHELAQRLERRNPSLKVIIATGNGSDQHERDLGKKRLLLNKPVDATVLLRAVRECLDGTAPVAAELG